MEEGELKRDFKEWQNVGSAAADTMSYARKITKVDTPLVEIAEKVEAYVEKKGMKFAFPINLSTENIAAHYTPLKGDGRVANNLIKIDLGISNVEGFLSDTASSIDLSHEGKFKDVIKASENGLRAGIKEMKHNAEIRNVGKAIQDAIKADGFEPIRNLSGHSIERWELHAGIIVPNYDNNNKWKIVEGTYASEPFATTGEGLVTDGPSSNIFIFRQKKPTRIGRDVLAYIEKEYKTLAFSSRWITNKFGPGALASLEYLRKQGIIYEFPQLIKRSGEYTSQSEHTIAVLKDKTVVLTERE